MPISHFLFTSRYDYVSRSSRRAFEASAAEHFAFADFHCAAFAAFQLQFLSLSPGFMPPTP
jgi:hypothetical protein